MASKIKMEKIGLGQKGSYGQLSRTGTPRRVRLGQLAEFQPPAGTSGNPSIQETCGIIRLTFWFIPTPASDDDAASFPQTQCR
jgi:hypothetical protein